MINLVKKAIEITTAIGSLLLIAPKALATDTIPIASALPGQMLGPDSIKIGNVPQFLITLLLMVGIVIAIVFLIYGGIRWILSGGDSKQVEAARNHIVAAIVGLVIVVGAFFILNIVFTILTGNPFSFNNLCIPTLTNSLCAGK
jgi:hypothetical protein